MIFTLWKVTPLAEFLFDLLHNLQIVINRLFHDQKQNVCLSCFFQEIIPYTLFGKPDPTFYSTSCLKPNGAHHITKLVTVSQKFACRKKHSDCLNPYLLISNCESGCGAFHNQAALSTSFSVIIIIYFIFDWPETRYDCSFRKFQYPTEGIFPSDPSPLLSLKISRLHTFL